VRAKSVKNSATGMGERTNISTCYSRNGRRFASVVRSTWKFRGKIQRGDAVNVTFLSRAIQEGEEREFAIVQLDKFDLYGRRA